MTKGISGLNTVPFSSLSPEESNKRALGLLCNSYRNITVYSNSRLKPNEDHLNKR